MVVGHLRDPCLRFHLSRDSRHGSWSDRWSLRLPDTRAWGAVGGRPGGGKDDGLQESPPETPTSTTGGRGRVRPTSPGPCRPNVLPPLWVTPVCTPGVWVGWSHRRSCVVTSAVYVSGAVYGVHDTRVVGRSSVSRGSGPLCVCGRQGGGRRSTPDEEVCAELTAGGTERDTIRDF